MTKLIFFDASTLISMATTCTLRFLEKLEKDFDGKFAITTAVKAEVLDKAEVTDRFRYEGIRLQHLVDVGTFQIYDDKKYKIKIDELMNLINSTFSAKNHELSIIQLGEVSSLATAVELNCPAIAIDERTCRTIIEKPELIKNVMEHKMHTRVNVNPGKVEQLKHRFRGISVIRSSDLAVAAFDKGYLGKKTRNLLDGILWAMKFNGCAITPDEIKQWSNRFFRTG